MLIINAFLHYYFNKNKLVKIFIILIKYHLYVKTL